MNLNKIHFEGRKIDCMDRELKGGLGVMMDDVLAGIAGGLLSALVLMGIGELF